MLSKKMTVSLMSLITILSIALIAPTAMAQFTVDMKIHPDDLLSVDPDAQADPTADKVRVIITFGEIVETEDKADTAKFSAKHDIEVFAQNKYGQPLEAPALSAASAFAPADGTNYIFDVPKPKSGTTQVVLFIAEGEVEAADPRIKRNMATGSKDNLSALATFTITYRDDFDHGAPRVYQIRRASPNDRLPVLTETASSFQAVITLSEQPKTFTEAHINVTGGTAGTPIALTPYEPLNVKTLTEYGNEQTIPGVRSLYNSGTGDSATLGLHGIINESQLASANTGDFTLATAKPTVPVSSALSDKVKGLVDKLGAYKQARGTAHGDAGISDNPFPNYPDLNSARNGTAASTDDTPHGLGETSALDIANEKDRLPRTAPGKKINVALFDGVSGAERGTAAEKDISGDPTKPTPKDYPVKEVYDNALSDYTTLKRAQDAYKAGIAVKDAYDALYKQMVMENNEVIEEYYLDLTNRDEIADLLKAMPTTGTDKKLHKYYVVIKPNGTASEVVVKVNPFEDLTLPTPLKYTPPLTDRGYTDGLDVLRVKHQPRTATPVATTAGIDVAIGKGVVIPKDGYLVIANKIAGSAVRNPGDAKKTPANPPREPFGLTYNLVEGNLQNLATLLLSDGTIDIVGAKKLVISEIMWGTDASLANPHESQYIELRNTSGAEIVAGDKDYKLVLYPAGTTLPSMSVAANNIQDRVSTIGWALVGKGQSGRTGVGEAPGDTLAIAPTEALASMQRKIDASGVAADGTDAMSWAQSAGAGVNFDIAKAGERIGSPGRAPLTASTFPTPEKPKPTPVVTVPVADDSDIMITEIMVDTGDGRLPQWIELTNVSGAEKSLAGWSVVVMNAADDADAVGTRVEIDLTQTIGVGGGKDRGGTMGKSLLLVAWDGRHSANLDGNPRVIDVSDTVGEKGRYKLISDMAFKVALLPPQKTGVLTYGDMAGNLDAAEAWDIPMDDTGRSSLIRRQTDYKPDQTAHVASMKFTGTSAKGWLLASKSSLVTSAATWYGSDEDAGTPGVDAGGPLPVELSHFRPARDKTTGAVVITWATQSELNNAGFFIKRSQQRDGEFKVINTTMIAGAGTTSEKQMYTYTDTTAQPNVVYYYQIEDVSLDGQRQLLTHGTRLKGHIGAAGKATTTWGDLKTSNE